ncbi:MAG: CBS domain-containing protein [Clostridiales bacterium]|nr:CBS domain-containing protein [Clostridiales bacterium]
MENLAKRFIQAYNKLDHTIKSLYNFKRGMPFSDCIRRAVSLNSVVRKFEDDLVDFSRLRNAIVHSSGDSDDVIAVPKQEVVEKIEHIAKLICTPPRVYDTVCRKDVLSVDSKVSVKETIGLISKSGYSNLPVYKDGQILGVANGQRILNKIGNVINDNLNVCNFLEKTQIEELVSGEKENFYTIASKDLTISEALNLFYQNRKLLVILITPNGNFLEMPIGIVTTSDILDINKILENY